MESELLCGICKKPYSCPIFLPCSHSVCMTCAKTNVTQTGNDSKTSTLPTQKEMSDSMSDDSGYVSVHELNHLYQAIGNIPCLKCPICSKIFPLDNRGVSGFPRNRLLENIVNRHYSKTNGQIYCQLCEKDPPAQASVMCEQCEVVYCDECCKTCHPSRGPLAKHQLIKPNAKSSVRNSTTNCGDHLEEHNSMYCVGCRIPVCYVCIEKGKHQGHEVKALGAIFKEQKGVVSSNILQLEQCTGQINNYINEMKANSAVIQENGLDFESIIVAQCDALIHYIQTRKIELLNSITKEVEKKVEQSNQQVSTYEKKMKEATALLYYSKEALSEVDPASFLLVANALITRITDLCSQWQNDSMHKDPPNMELDLTLDTAAATQALQDLQFIELKAPCAPDIIPDQCSVTNNAITLCWKPRKRSCVEGYVVELDDGGGGNFIEVFRGNSLECTVQGLQFDSTYRARIKGVNAAGEGAPSDEVYLTTSDIAWFSMDKETAHPEIVLSNDNNTATCTSYDDRVVLGNAGFSKGCHYWEITIDRYDGNPDPAMGVAMASTMKDTILGKDDKAWCMYIDSSRSWFRHNNEHSNRRDGGIEVGSVVGIFLDVGSHKISFYLNDEKRGAIRLPEVNEPLYPAFSLNRNVQITLHTGLEPPDSQVYIGRN